MKRDTSNFLQKNICTYYLPFLKKLCIEFEVFRKSREPTSSFLGVNLDPIGQAYVRRISAVHFHEIFHVNLEKKSLWNSGIFRYYEIRPVSNQPAQFFVPAKTHKFKSLEEINVDQLKLRSIIDQTGTYIYNASKVMAKYFKSSAKNQFTTSGTLTFPDLSLVPTRQYFFGYRN